MLRIHAGSVHPVTAPPIEDGAVLVDDRGTIAAVGPHPLVPAPPGARELAFPDASLVPGLVNTRSEEHTSELQSLTNLVCRLLLEKKKKKKTKRHTATSRYIEMRSVEAIGL